MPAPELPEFAPDARIIIEAWREAGSVSFNHLSIEQARDAYRATAAKNGLAPQQVASIDDITLSYGVADAAVRLYRPLVETAEPLPCIVYLHGGGWVLGGLDTHDSVCRYLANQAGAVVAAVDYRLAPEHRYPAAVVDSRTALSAIGAQAEELGIDLDRIAVAGDSAGGTLAAILAIDSRDGRAPAITGQVLLYPVTDLSRDSASYERMDEGVPLLAATMHWFGGHYLGNADPSAWDASPLLLDDFAGLADAFVVTLGFDPLADEGIEYAGRLAHAGVNVTHHHLAPYPHGMFTSAGVVREGERMLAEAAAFLQRGWA